MKRTRTRLLSRRDVARLLDLGDCTVAVEAAFRANAEGRTIPPAVLGVPVEGGGFHLKAAGVLGERSYFVTKINGNFYRNQERFGLPRIQGLVVLCDAANGFPLAVMDSAELTLIRTAAATAVAAKYLARTDSSVATICGCGLQGAVQLEAVCSVRPIATAYAFDSDLAVAEAFSSRIAAHLGIDGLEVVPVDDLGWASRRSQICVTCTPSNVPLLGSADVAPGAFIAAVGADSEEKQELDPALLAKARVVVDHLEQCAAIGELHHALDSGVLSRAEVHAELEEIVAGRRPGRTTDEEIFVFDSTGVALQDVAAAILVFERAVADGVGQEVELLS